MNKVIDPQVLPYLMAVRERLSGLPAGEADEILNDVEQHLSELVALEADPLFERLGPAKAYADELAQSAGWTSVLSPSTRFQQLANWKTTLATSDPGRRWTQLWRELRPGWWVIRGLAVGLIWSSLYTGMGVAEFLWAIPAVFVSIFVGRKSVTRAAWRRVDLIANGVAAWMLIAAAMNGITIIDSTQYHLLTTVRPGLMSENGPISDFVAYDVRGQQVSVFLYDQEGHPVFTEDPGNNPVANL